MDTNALIVLRVPKSGGSCWVARPLGGAALVPSPPNTSETLLVKTSSHAGLTSIHLSITGRRPSRPEAQGSGVASGNPAICDRFPRRAAMPVCCALDCHTAQRPWLCLGPSRTKAAVAAGPWGPVHVAGMQGPSDPSQRRSSSARVCWVLPAPRRCAEPLICVSTFNPLRNLRRVGTVISIASMKKQV